MPPIHHRNSRVIGAATDLYAGMQNAVKLGISKEATLNPAKAIGYEREIGSFAPGKRADFILCDESLNRQKVYLNGEEL